MAEIPVRKSGGAPTWLWLLLPLILIALLVWWWASDDEVETAAVVDPAVVGAPDVAGGPITDLTAITAANRAMLVGRSVDIDNVPVQRVVSDRTFFVGQPGQEVAVVLNEVPTPTTATEGRYDVTPGQMVDINGVMRRLDDPAIAPNVAGVPAGTDVVVHAMSLDITNP